MIKYLKNAIWIRAKSNDVTISYAIVVSISALCDRHLSLAFSSCTITYLPHGLGTISSCTLYIYSIDIIMYPYTLLIITISSLFSSLCLSIT